MGKKCKLGKTPEAYGYCSEWIGSKGMTAMPAVGNICDYCLNYVEDEDQTP